MKTIKKTDLRVGNLIQYEQDGSVFEVLEIQELGVKVKDSEQVTWIEYDVWGGVPLTEDWLIRAGFNTNNNKTFAVSFYDITKKHNSNYFVFEFECYMIDMPNIEIKYIHELQNFHFALTQTELTFKD